MVTIVGFTPRSSEEGKNFFALVLQGDIEFIKSKTGKLYATAKKASIPSSFDETTCEKLIGKKLSGKIIREAVEPYSYSLPSGDKVELDYCYVYDPDQKTTEEVVFEGAL